MTRAEASSGTAARIPLRFFEIPAGLPGGRPDRDLEGGEPSELSLGDLKSLTSGDLLTGDRPAGGVPTADEKRKTRGIRRLRAHRAGRACRPLPLGHNVTTSRHDAAGRGRDVTGYGQFFGRIPRRRMRAFKVVRGMPIRAAARFLFPSVCARTERM